MIIYECINSRNRRVGSRVGVRVYPTESPTEPPLPSWVDLRPPPLVYLRPPRNALWPRETRPEAGLALEPFPEAA